MRGSKGYYSGTRSLLRKPQRERGKPHISKLLHEYELGSEVIY
jgi:ribosomal protein L21E